MSLWNDLDDPVFAGVTRAGLRVEAMSSCWPRLLFLFFDYYILLFFLPLVGRVALESLD